MVIRRPTGHAVVLDITVSLLVATALVGATFDPYQIEEPGLILALLVGWQFTPAAFTGRPAGCRRSRDGV